jgi:hypothetical protein
VRYETLNAGLQKLFTITEVRTQGEINRVHENSR